ncbi:sensor histidine kinase N-terminal domain-containing protein [Ensifer adhaerens]|uniref:ATP-binding protein n=1 Tax=Ensifer adhaerens TaxID=106592 RepID=UPI001CC04BF9|nr:ATP-binding protein [Ensifer adhaerens]MBZ7927014.1 sensor histidine kinase N-terminal domain-containing protein [Ensifer adhaerens]UAX96682.1 sensor histidine kinase N-terminal domain-containing protein [Ensifer adhaerens]UAY03974.1 sensor histidine kinase N-terminal domain-containing protein [Ensifer adhaerens]UAY11960.1 sensor histidine kinase N-terminal domain-containing protein [Ensifer adhaerens]
MRSLRTRLFAILLLTTGLLWLSATVWIFLSTRAEVERVLDARLMEAARMVNSLIVSPDIMKEEADTDANRLAQSAIKIPLLEHPHYDRQLSCQIWSLDGTLIGKSDSAPETTLAPHAMGFSETVINGETWRVFAVENASLGVRVLVGDNLRIRDRLVNDLVKGLLLPALLIIPLLAVLIWLSVGRGLAPLRKLAGDLAAREASDLHAIEDVGTTREISPVLKSLNGLFARVAGAREREQNFIAFAAHELRTPLAGLKTQAQVALASDDGEIREKALGQIVAGVDRTGKLVRQLLDIASVEATESTKPAGTFNVGDILSGLRTELGGHHRVDVAIDARLFDIKIGMDPDLFRLAARNLLENAINHSPSGATVSCSGEKEAGRLVIAINDTGPGIPDEEMPHVTERFFRGRFKTSVGSGLGLSIVERALDRTGAELELRNRESGGLSARIVLPQGLVQ